MKQNILALYLTKLSKWFPLVMPIIALLYEDHGLGLQGVFILKSIYSVTAATLEILSGHLVNIWGRKKCLILGCTLFFGGYLCYSFTFTFTAFLLTEILLGTGQTSVNGTDSALFYNTTVRYKKEELYLWCEGRITMIGNFAEAVAGIFGGSLAAYSLRLPSYAQTFVAFTSIPAAFTLQEFNTKSKVQNPVSEILRILKHSLVMSRKLCYNIVFFDVIGVATLVMAWFIQPVLTKLGTPTSYYGVIWTVLSLTVGSSAFYSDRVERYFGMHRSNTFILLIIVSGYVSFAYNLIYRRLAILLIFYIIWGFATLILKGYIN